MSGKFNKFKIIWLYLASDRVLLYVLNLYKTPSDLRPGRFYYNFFKKTSDLRPHINSFIENYWSPGLRLGFIIYYKNSKYKLTPGLNSFM